MKKVFVNARFLSQPISGVQNFALNLCQVLKERRPETTFVCCQEVMHPELVSLLDVQLFGRSKGAVWEQFELPAYLKKNESPLLINFCNTAPVSYKNQFNTIHDLAFEKDEEWFNKRFKYYYRWLIPQVARNCRQLFSVSNFSADEISNQYTIDRSGIEILPNSISREIENYIITETSINNDVPYFLTVSSMDPRKNLETILNVFDALHFKGIKLKIIGRKNSIFKKNEKQKHFAENPMIEWIEDADNRQLVNYYKHAIALINLSLYEGFGLNNLEAMASGCPLLISDIPVFHEVCEDAAIYVDPLDKIMIANQMLKLLHNKDMEKSMKEAGLKRSKAYSREQSASVLIKHIEAAGY